VNLVATAADEVFQNLVQKDQVRFVTEELQQVAGVGGKAGFIVGPHEFISILAAQFQSDPAPHCFDANSLRRLALGGIEELAVKDRDANVARAGQAFGLRKGVQRLALPFAAWSKAAIVCDLSPPNGVISLSTGAPPLPANRLRTSSRRLLRPVVM